MRVVIVGVVVLAACGAPSQRPSDSPIPARAAMDSAQIDRVCANPAHVRVGLLECELKDQAPVLPFDPLALPR